MIRSLAVGWWILLVAVDLAVYLYVSPMLSRGYTEEYLLQGAADFGSTVFFWIGAFLLLSVLLGSRFGERRLRLARALYAVMVLVGAGFFFYLFFVWGFVARNGHLPDPETVVFLTENLSRLPQHLVQTSPASALLGVLAALAASYLTLGAATIANGVPDSPPWRRRRIAFALVFLAAWHVISPFGSFLSPASMAFSRDVEVITQAKANLYLQTLGARAIKEAESFPVQKRYPVVVLLVESLRHDLLTETPQAIPFLKSLSEENIGFSKAYAVASHSNLTDLAFWYGQYPLRGRGRERYPVDAPWRGTSLFGAFKSAGYRTAYISSQNEGWGNMVNWLKTPDVDFFFDSENYSGPTWENQDDEQGLAGMIRRGILNAGKVEDSETLHIARRWIDNNGRGGDFILGMNLQNTHFSYIMPPGGAEPFQPSDLGFRAVYYTWPKEKKENVRNRYLNAVSNVDRLIRDFADYLKQRGLWDECLFVVLGDNGEGFYEHGFGNHSGPMYDEAVRTLSIVKLPASLKSEARKITFPISHIDIAASIPRIVGVPVPGTFQGVPVLPDGGNERPVFMYSNAIVRQYGIVSGSWKLLINESAEPPMELFNLDLDPGEKVNVVDVHRALVEDLREKLLVWVKVQTTYYAEGMFNDRTPPLYLEFGGDADGAKKMSNALPMVPLTQFTPLLQKVNGKNYGE